MILATSRGLLVETTIILAVPQKFIQPGIILPANPLGDESTIIFAYIHNLNCQFTS